ncbi:MAG: hypothetical protein CMJ58_28495 [Planctomycetaceae bacterium]|nr:hypothetical protein [Planctomycetaceae bacterium]
MEQLQRIRAVTSRLKLDDSLLFLNHVLGVRRGFASDPELEPLIRGAHPPVLPHIVHFLAKQLLLNASNFGTTTLGWDQFQRLMGLCIDLDDPIQHDPNWKHADPSGFFERLLSQQINPQNRNILQKYGLALGLFRDVGIIEWPKPYDLRSEIEGELGMAVESFMQLGQVTFSLRTASLKGNKCIGTFTSMILAEAFQQGIQCCVPELWTPFLQRVSCDREQFRHVSHEEFYFVEDDLFQQFGLNPLRRFPITRLGHDRYLAVDPELIVERVAFGLFYDLFERNGTRFSNQFGYAFDQFVGQLLNSACPTERLWSAAEWEKSQKQRKPHSMKIGDWAYTGEDCTVLLECKSLRPTVELTTFGTDDSLAKVINRVASAIKQLIGHAASINEGKWEELGLCPRRMIGVVVTYGKFFTINGPFVRKRIHKILTDEGLEPIPFVVLSLEELDSVMRLVELGNGFDTLINRCATDEDSFDPLFKYRAELKQCAVSSSTFSRGDTFLKQITAGAKQ